MNCFQLLDKETGQAMDLNVVDEELCAHFGIEVDPKYWYRSWYDIVGLGLSMGQNWDTLLERIPEYRDIIEFMRERYDVRAWAER